MSPSATKILAGYAFIARRYGFAPEFDDEALFAALRLAVELSADERDETAALFFTLARPSVFGQGWRVMARTIAGAHAAKLGQTIGADVATLDALANKIAEGEATYPDVRGWFAVRLRASE